ncbi:rRNA maturation RNase YbeY [Acetobacteraceae bacterium ESL0709]|nr:rRNA maturation RNase YbeY [Acetobacteraceae bacterium ESL0697]MDF7678221.1 rRNA maturation RNase YbeY [Acetobacteraceae bacterium ESL0709]
MVPRSPLSKDDSPDDYIIPNNHILIEDRRWHCYGTHPERLTRMAFTATRRVLGNDAGLGYPEFVFSTDRSVKKLNARFRDKNKPTNVLTFEPSFPGGNGSIILAFETVQREAREAQLSLKARTAHLIVHGLLHLAGYDHHHPGDAKAMEAKETRILRMMGLADPWKSVKRTTS